MAQIPIEFVEDTRGIERARDAMVDGLDDMKSAAGKASGSVDKVGTSSLTAGKSATASFKAAKVAVLAFVVGVGKALQKVADLRNELVDLETRTGITAETLGGLRLAFEGSGLKAADMAGIVTQIPKIMSDVEKGSSRATKGLDLLGISTEDMTAANVTGEQAIRKITDAIYATEDPTQRAAAATALFGANGTKLLQALGEKEALDAFVELSDRFGVGVGPAAAAAAASWQRELATFKTVLVGALADLTDFVGGAELLNDFTAGFVFLKEIASAAIDAVLERIKFLGKAVDLVLKGEFGEAFTFVGAALSPVILDLDEMAERATDAMDSFVKLSKAANQGSGSGGGLPAVAENAEEVAEEVAKVAPAAKKSAEEVEELVEALGEVAVDVPSTFDRVTEGIYTFQGGLSSVLSMLGPQGALVAAAVDLITNLRGTLEGLRDEILAFATGLADAPDAVKDFVVSLVEEVIPALVDSLDELGTALADMLTDPEFIGAVIKLAFEMQKRMVLGAPEMAVAFVKALWEKAIDGLNALADTTAKELWASIKRGIGDFVRDLWQGVKDMFDMGELFGDDGLVSRTGEAIGNFFSDTPGVVQAGGGGATATFSEGDLVVASQTPEGLARQIGGMGGGGGPSYRQTHRIFDAFVKDHLRASSTLRRATGGGVTGRVNPYTSR